MNEKAKTWIIWIFIILFCLIIIVSVRNSIIRISLIRESLQNDITGKVIEGYEQTETNQSEEPAEEAIPTANEEPIEIEEIPLTEEKEGVETTPKVNEEREFFKVVNIVDGDTIDIDTGGRIRLICTDSPEYYEDYHQEAKNYLTNLILNKEVKLVKDVSEIDKYGRLLRYIYTKEGQFVNELIVLNGWARAYPYPPDTSLCPQIQEAEKKAKQSNLGIWVASINQQNTTYICSYNAYNCDYFSTHSQAQSVFEACGGIRNDIHQLDRDKDGLACETLP